MSPHRPILKATGTMPVPIMSPNLPARPGEAVTMASGATAAWIAGQRLHLQHGPIDLIIGADGAADKVGAAFAAAANCFAELLPQLVAELPHLRQPARQDMPVLKGPVAARMQAAVNRFLSGPAPAPFVTAMAAVAGAVADHVLAAMSAAAGPGLPRAYVNNGGDIALTLGPDACFEIGVADDRDVRFSDFMQSGHVGQPVALPVHGQIRLTRASGVGGVATSGWRGRSLSCGIADSVTVLAANAATADVAATLIANAVTVESDQVKRAPASEIDPDSDLGDRLVTVDVGHLSDDEVGAALTHGQRLADSLCASGHIVAVYGRLGGRGFVVGQQPGDG